MIDAPVVRIAHRSLTRNTLANLGGNALPLLAALLATPVIVRHMTAEEFGILALSWALLGYLSIFDLGVSRAATKFGAEAIGRGDERAIGRIAWTALSMQVVLGVLGGLAAAAATGFLVTRVLKISPALTLDARTCFYILSASFPFVLMFNGVRALLEAAHRFDIVNYVRAPFNVLNSVIPMLAVLAGASLPEIVLWLSLARILAFVSMYLMARRVLPSLRRFTPVHGDSARRMIKFGGWVSVSNTISPVLVYSDRLIVGSVASVAALGFYSIPLEIVTRLLMIPASLVTAIFPIFSMSAKEPDAAVRHLFKKAVRYTFLVMAPMVLVLVVFSHPILRLWAGPEFAEAGSLPLKLLAVGVLANALALIPFVYLQASGRPDLPARFHLVELPIHIGLAFLLVSRWGAAGAALAWALRTTLDAALLFAAARSKLRVTPSGAGTRTSTIPGSTE